MFDSAKNTRYCLSLPFLFHSFMLYGNFLLYYLNMHVFDYYKCKEDFCFGNNASNKPAVLLEILFFFHDLEIGLPSCTQGRLFTKLYKSSNTKTAQRLSLQQLITITTWQVIRLIHLMSQLTIIRALHQFCLSYHALDHCTFP